MIEGFLSQRAPRLPRRDSVVAWMSPLVASVTTHAAIVALLAVALIEATSPIGATAPRENAAFPAARIVFLLPSRGPGGGGGGGGNRQPTPIRRAQRVGTDPVTVSVARPLTVVDRPVNDPAPAQPLALDAKLLASGVAEVIGALEGVSVGFSQGPGSGGGVGDGVGTGLGPGRGPGLGPGTGGGTGGGVYQPGGGVTAPTLISQVRPSYTSDALRYRTQGTVVLEVVVRRDGIPSDIRVLRSLDRGGLDEQAIAAVQQWRFNPGRLGGTPVDVLVTVVLDFSIR